uniref:Uncharacterized protein n=1 Tax=Bracon brevicornis TaxID=1563983 RepID=A0A6V7L883_9HYME
MITQSERSTLDHQECRMHKKVTILGVILAAQVVDKDLEQELYWGSSYLGFSNHKARLGVCKTEVVLFKPQIL